MEYSKYLRSFVIASSAIASVPWMWSQDSLRQKENTVNYDYYSWSWQMPIRHGFWNIASLMIAEYFNLTLRNRFVVITFLDWIITILSSKIYNSYIYNDKQWNEYYRNLFIKQAIWWNFIIYNLEKYIPNGPDRRTHNMNSLELFTVIILMVLCVAILRLFDSDPFK